MKIKIVEIYKYLVCFTITISMSASCSRELPEIKIGDIESFSISIHEFEVNVENIDLGWYMGFRSDDFYNNDKFRETIIKISVKNTSMVILNASFLQHYYEIMPEKTIVIYEGLVSEFWDQGGVIILHNFENELKYFLEIECSDAIKLTDPILIYLYTQDAQILPSF